jgi:hypothetical protein
MLMALLGVAPDAVRDQVMRHDPFTGVFNGAYINHVVRFNVQDAFLESDVSDDGLTRAFTHMIIRRNPGAPKEVPNEVMERLFAADPDIVDLERRFKTIYGDQVGVQVHLASAEGEAKRARRPSQATHEYKEKLENRDRGRIPEGLFLSNS